VIALLEVEPPGLQLTHAYAELAVQKGGRRAVRGGLDLGRAGLAARTVEAGEGNGVRPRVECRVEVRVQEAYIHCRKYLPHLVKADGAGRAWGTDDARAKGGDYFGASCEPRSWVANSLGFLEGHDRLPPCLYRGQDGLLVFVLDLKLLKGSLQVPGHPVKRLAGDLEVGMSLVQVTALVFAWPTSHHRQQGQHVPAQALKVLVV
jgi:hypothetical protein